MQGLKGKKILYVITKSNWGGAQAYVYALATAAKDAEAEVVVALGGTGEAGAATGRLAAELQKIGIRTITVENFMRDISFFREFKVLAELRTIFTREKPDIVHVNSSKAGGIGALAARLAGVPKIIFTSHGLAYDEDKNIFTRTFRWFATWITILLTHTTIMISDDTYDRARALPFCRNKIRLIYNGIEQPAFWPRKEARAKLAPAAPKDALWIGTISELTPNKSLPTLVSAVAQLKSAGNTTILVIIGEGEERQLLTKLIKDARLEDTIYLAGFVPNAANFLSAFDIFALVSTKEGLPYVLLEAAEAHCAVVASRIGGITDIVTSETGILVTPKSVKETAEALTLLSTDGVKRLELAAKLHARVEERFSIKRMQQETGAVYI